MVKEHACSETILRCSVKKFFEALYADGEAAKAYHREVDGDENTQVDSWQGNTRTIHFTMPMQLPSVLLKLIGSSSIPVREVQQAEMDSNGALHIISTPIIGVPGGSKFQAIARLIVTNTSQSGIIACQVDARITCTADGPWGLQGMIESVMVEQAAASIKGYLIFCTQRCQATLTMQEAMDEEPTSPQSDVTSFDQFFDAQETISRVSSIASSQGLGLALSPDSDVVDTVALLRLLDTLDGRLGLLASDLSAIRSLVPPFSPQHPSQPAKIASTARLGVTPWMLGFLCGALVVGATGVALRRQGKM